MMNWADRENLSIRHKHIKLPSKIKLFYYLVKLETKRTKKFRRKRDPEGRGQIQAIAEANQRKGKDPVTRRL